MAKIKDKRITRTVNLTDARYADDMTLNDLISGMERIDTGISDNQYRQRIGHYAKDYKVQIRKWNDDTITARGLPQNMTNFLNRVWQHNGGWTTQNTIDTGRKSKKSK